MKILDVGCGPNKYPGAVGMDMNPMCNPDVVHNLEDIPYPFEDDEFDRIHLSQVLEHTRDIVPIMKELHRICKPGAEVYIVVPHFSGKTAYMDPSHKSFFGWPTFTYFTKDYFYTGAKYEIVKQWMSFQYFFRYTGIAFLANKFPRFYEDFLHGIIPARNLLVIMRVIK